MMGAFTTGHAILKLNKADQQRRRFILVEMKPTIARNLTAERVRRVAAGYTNAKGAAIQGLGGGFRYCQLGEPLFDENGKIRETVSFGELARHVYFTETGEPLPRGEYQGRLFSALVGESVFTCSTMAFSVIKAQMAVMFSRVRWSRSCPHSTGQRSFTVPAACWEKIVYKRSGSLFGKHPMRSK